MAIDFALPTSDSSIIKVFGVGGGGSNAVNNMFTKGIKGVEFYVFNTDIQDLNRSPVVNRVALGAKLTNGLGAGSKPEVGKNAALESVDVIREILKKSDTRMVFITAGMGGGTGTGAAPVIAALAKELGILTVGIVTTPFSFEGPWRTNLAKAGIEQMERSVDTLIVINNQNLLKISSRGLKQREAFIMADKVLCDAAKGISELVTGSGYINLDFADVETIMKDGGTAIMGTATFEGENRAIQAIEEALNCPLLENTEINGASGVLINISASEESLALDEVDVIMDYVYKAVGEDARIIFGTVYDETMQDRLAVTIIATGFNKKKDELPLPNSKYSNKSLLDSLSTQKEDFQNNIPKHLESPSYNRNFLAEPLKYPETEPIAEHLVPKVNPVIEEIQASKPPQIISETPPEKPAKNIIQKSEPVEKQDIPVFPQKQDLDITIKEEIVIAGINKKSLDTTFTTLSYHSTEDLVEFEKPAYLRYNLPLEKRERSPNIYSTFSISEDNEGGCGLTNNSNPIIYRSPD
ncbi:MAG: cell division protein FtsZ [Bacteroidia bacterium]|nr:cell division protein FtsZ [Bacteroidia bacterium]